MELDKLEKEFEDDILKSSTPRLRLIEAKVLDDMSSCEVKITQQEQEQQRREEQQEEEEETKEIKDIENRFENNEQVRFILPPCRPPYPLPIDILID